MRYHSYIVCKSFTIIVKKLIIVFKQLTGYLYSISKNESFRKYYCTLGLRVRVRVRVGLRVRAGISGNIFSAERVFKQV